MSDYPFSQSRLGTYTKCQRMYEFEYDWDVTVPNKQERYFDRGTVLHATIEDVCDKVAAESELSDDAIRDYAMDRLAYHWKQEMDPDEYYSDAEFKEDRVASEARIRAFFDSGPGITHARTSIATEKRVSLERNGIEYTGYIDNILRTETGLTLVDYKTSSISPPFSREYVKQHLEEGYRPDRVKPAMQTAIYVEAIKTTDLYDPEMELEFVFYELRKSRSKEVTRLPGQLEITVEGNARHVADGYRQQKEDVWKLIDQSTAAVRDANFTPEPFREIYDDTCSGCDFRTICPEYLEEVSGL